MTITEYRNSADYAAAVEKIKSYKPGFTFTIYYNTIPTRKAKALEIVLADACKIGIIESLSIGLTLNGKVIEETYRRKEIDNVHI